MRKMKSCFTLIELLVVIAIIAILAGMMLPALNKARDRARESSCFSNLRQFGIGLTMYRNDFKEQMPPWLSTLHLHNYLKTDAIYRCAKDGNSLGTSDDKWLARPDGTYDEVYDVPGRRGEHGNPTSGLTRISYFYEFSEALCSFKPDGGLTWNEQKFRDMRDGLYEEDGSPMKGAKYSANLGFFPTVRCYWHYKNPKEMKPVLNVSFLGNTFYSLAMWEKGTWK